MTRHIREAVAASWTYAVASVRLSGPAPAINQL